MELREALVPGPIGPLRIGYADWGDPASGRAVVCVHGLTRQGRDFDALAAACAEAARVLCPDVPGRGRSAWLHLPELYALPTYAGVLAALLAQLGLSRVDWVGTSMGGLIGMALAAMDRGPVQRLVLNDVGPLIEQAALAAIGRYAGRDPRFADMAGLEAYLREIHAGFGPLTGAQWRHLALHGARRFADGNLGLAYDPAIGHAFRGQAGGDLDLWAIYDAVGCPTLVLRGAESPLLSAPTAAEMARRGPRAEVVEVAGCGHAPALMDPAQIAVVRGFLGL